MLFVAWLFGTLSGCNGDHAEVVEQIQGPQHPVRISTVRTALQERTASEEVMGTDRASRGGG